MDPEEIGTGGQVDYDYSMIHDFVWEDLDD